MYITSNTIKYIILLAPFFLLLYIQAPLQSALFALDLAKYAMWNSLIGSIVKFVVLVLLASNAQFGIMGVAIAICTSVVFITILHLVTLYQTVRFTIPWKDCVKMIVLIISTYLAGSVLHQVFEDMLGQLLTFMVMLVMLMLIYLVLVILLRFITKEEMKQIPYIRNFFRVFGK